MYVQCSTFDPKKLIAYKVLVAFNLKNADSLLQVILRRFKVAPTPAANPILDAYRNDIDKCTHLAMILTNTHTSQLF